MNSNQNGFSPVQALLVLVVVGVIGFAGWRVYDSQTASDSQQASTQGQDEVPAVNSASDLKDVEDYLNSQDIEEDLNTTELDEALAE